MHTNQYGNYLTGFYDPSGPVMAHLKIKAAKQPAIAVSLYVLNIERLG